MLRELFTQLYKKLEEEKENDKKSKNGYFDFFVNKIMDNDAKKSSDFGVTSKTIKNYYDKYVEERDNNAGEPKNKLKDFIAVYLGYKNYTDFERVNSKENITQINPKNKYVKVFKIASGLLIFMLCFYYINHFFTDDYCIIWKGNYYETTSCKTENAIDNRIYHVNIEKFKKVKVNEETTFFENGNPVIWYGKSAFGRMEYFNHRGIHPETLKELDPITEYMINKYVFINKEEKTLY